MTQAPPALNAFTVGLLQGEGLTIEQMQKNAQSKQYNFSVQVKVTETTNNKPYFDNDWLWTAIPYTAVVLLEKALLDIVNQLTVVGAELATGGEFTPPAK